MTLDLLTSPEVVDVEAQDLNANPFFLFLILILLVLGASTPTCQESEKE